MTKEDTEHLQRTKRMQPNLPSKSGLGKLLNQVNTFRLSPPIVIIGISILFISTTAIAIVVAIGIRGILQADRLSVGAEASIAPESATPNATPNPTFQAPTFQLGNEVEWEGTEPVSILLLGGDSRPDQGPDFPPRTDTVMILMIDPVRNVAGMLSIPRDLWVDIPGYGVNRINTAYFWGGGDLTMETIQYNFGVRINYYVLVQFDAFVAFIDEIGGIDVNVERDIYDSEYPTMNYQTEVFSLSAGEHHLDGETALKYVRTRHNDSDFNRARRQQQVLFAIQDRILRPDMLPTLIDRAPALYSATSDSIDTNMQLNEILALATIAKDIPAENIRTAVLDYRYSTQYTTPAGAWVLIPKRDALSDLFTEVFWLDN